MPASEAWAQFSAGLQAAGARLGESELDPVDCADGYRALVRALNNRLSRFETDSDTPELTGFNSWREKFFMDNPDYHYWIADIRDDCSYRISGNVGDSVYQSITVYTGSGIADAAAVSRQDSDTLGLSANGDYEVLLSRENSGPQPWLAVPEDASSVWVRHILGDARNDDPGWCRIDQVSTAKPPSKPRPDRFDRDLAGLGNFISSLPQAFEWAVCEDLQSPNTVRYWNAMAGGAAFTEPGIRYLRGAWQLEPDEALVLEGSLPSCRHWNIVLYNRFLNSLDYRRHTVSYSPATASTADGQFRFVLADQEPAVDGYDWLDTQGRRFGLFVMRFLQPEAEPSLPTVACTTLGALRAAH
jgi:hypothetical protein